jgi:phospholipid/cholesterol/gamma-HCH transport system ATP-binding protein
MNSTTIKVSNIHTQFGEQIVHAGVSFTINKPQVIAIIGGSGSGKSVLLREILGLEYPNQGEIELFGHNIHQISTRLLTSIRSRIGVLFQESALFSGLTVAENVAIPLLEHSEIPQTEINEIVKLRLALSGLGFDALNKLPSQLSGGMKKRASLARALSLEPELLFLDEPTSGLDPINARAFDELVRSLCDNIKLTILMVTHDLDSLFGIVDRVIVLADKKVIADGDVTAVSHVDHPWIKTYFSVRGRSSVMTHK